MTSNASVPALNRWFVNVGVGLGLVLSFAFAFFASAPAAAAEDAAPPPAAQEAAPAMLGAGMGQGFGAAGQVAIDGDLSSGLQKFKGGSWTLTIQPAADYFVIPNVSVGLLFLYQHSSSFGSPTTIGVRPRAGYALSFTDHLGIWPLVGFTYQHASSNGQSASGSVLDLNLPLMIHIVPHLFAGIGPYYNLKVSNATTNYGFASMVGGWF
jgi:hypothetical protein